MTALVWDQAGDRRYEAGIDRGVLYPLNSYGYSWSGLVSVSESRSREVKSYYLDGIKYLDYAVPGSYAAKLQAFTYPDILDILLGNAQIAPGVIAYDQKAGNFNLSYRTRIGNDVDGTAHGYKIHLLYNLTAAPSDADFDSLSDSASAKPFEWNLTGAPNQAYGMRPTSHISIDSTQVNPAKLAAIEARIYGSDTNNASMPNVDILLQELA